MAQLIGYARISTIDQDLDGQRQRLKDAGAIRVFEDVISGRTFERPGLTALLEFCRPGDIVCIVRLDRLGRSLRQLLDTVELFQSREIGLSSLEEKIDTSSAAGELIFHLFSCLAHFERRLIGERTKDGIAAARARGKKPGRPQVNDQALDAAMKLVAAGYSPSRAAQTTKIGRSTLYREIRLRPTIESSQLTHMERV